MKSFEQFHDISSPESKAEEVAIESLSGHLPALLRMYSQEEQGRVINEILRANDISFDAFSSVDDKSAREIIAEIHEYLDGFSDPNKPEAKSAAKEISQKIVDSQES